MSTDPGSRRPPSVSRAAAVVAALAAVAACATGASGARGSSGDPGEDLYRAKCALCHRLHDPGSRTRAEWARQVERMAPRAHLSDEDRARVLEYVQAHAKDAP